MPNIIRMFNERLITKSKMYLDNSGFGLAWMLTRFHSFFSKGKQCLLGQTQFFMENIFAYEEKEEQNTFIIVHTFNYKL